VDRDPVPTVRLSIVELLFIIAFTGAGMILFLAKGSDEEIVRNCGSRSRLMCEFAGALRGHEFMGLNPLAWAMVLFGAAGLAFAVYVLSARTVIRPEGDGIVLLWMRRSQHISRSALTSATRSRGTLLAKTVLTLNLADGRSIALVWLRSTDIKLFVEWAERTRTTPRSASPDNPPAT
jgi:hypothetical protein